MAASPPGPSGTSSLAMEASKPDVWVDCPGWRPWTGRDAEGYRPSEGKRDAALAQEVARHALHARGEHGAGPGRSDFGGSFSDGLMPTLGAGHEARLLWYANHAHGTGPAYT